MSRKASITLVTVTGLLVLALLVFSVGCDKGKQPTEQERLERAYEFSIKDVGEELADKGDLVPPYGREAWLEEIELFKARRVGAAPRLMFAIVETESPDSGFMLLEWLELDKDTMGILIIERDADGKNESVEMYPNAPMYDGYRKDPEFHLRRQLRCPVRIRTRWDGGQVKDVAEWHRWELGAIKTDWPPAPIWVSLPSDRRIVEAAMYDEMGHISNIVPVRISEK